eukprot:TRINITY_DN12698_c1_g2_i7.p2 TRINITY_DN12698_c1_g2~~TRINITY_DN12698_c1_g2_i7.p2  ORF type:complete len:460 (+),score=145.77 TRINITY_DN12698_c1_g2_i7:152-1531(+)
MPLGRGKGRKGGKGVRRPGGKGFFFAGMTETEQYCRACIDDLDAWSLQEVISESDVLLGLAGELKMVTAEDLIARFQRWCDKPHQKLANVLAFCVVAAVEQHKQKNLVAAHQALISAFKAFNQLLSDVTVEQCARPSWLVGIMSTLMPQLREVALLCERAEGKRGKRMDEVASQFQTTLNKCGSDKQAATIEQSKKLALVTICNNLAKTAFYTNNMGIVKPALLLLSREVKIFKTTHQVDFLDKYIPMGQRVAHNYFYGRIQMLDQSFQAAEEVLQEAFVNCHRTYKDNKVRILVFLITVKLIQGKFPSEKLLLKYGVLGRLFQPLVDACMEGNVAQFDAAMEENATTFAKLGIYVMLHRARLVAFLTLIRRTYVALYLLKPEDDVFRSRIKVQTFADAYQAVNGQSIDLDELECLLVYLISDGHIKGYISRQHRTVVLDRRANPFPQCAACDWMPKKT